MSSGRISSFGLTLFTLLGCAFWNGQTWAAPMSAKQAELAVAGWLNSDSMPLGAQLGSQVGEAVSYLDGDEIAYHVVPLKPSGFVIVAADDWVEPIVAFSSVGVYDPSPENPLGALVTQDVPKRIKAVRSLQAQNGATLPPPTQRKWTELIAQSETSVTTGLSSVSDLRVSPLVASKWNQDNECSAYCYNYYTPSHYPSGCVATAIAQLLRYYQHPTTGIGSRSCTIYVNGASQTVYTRGGNGSGGPYSWTQMPLDPDCTLTTTQREAIGALLFDAGATVRMDYAAGGSGADVFLAVDALTGTFGYTNGIKGYSTNNFSGVLSTMINPNMDAGYPIILGISGSPGGHAVLADGYGYNTSTLYHHINMGWGGYYDAWYNLPLIDAGSYVFNTVDVVLYNLYVSGTGEIISGRVTDLGGNPISGATVTATKSGGGTYTDTTDSRGIYALVKVPSASTYTVAVTKTGYNFANQNTTTGTSSHWGTTCGNRWGINFVSTTGQPPQASAASIDVDYNIPQTITLTAADDGVPNPPGALAYIIKSLPAHGTLSLPGGANITTAPYTIPSYGNRVVYTPATNYTGNDSFTFTANDGGTAPNGGESSTATISLTVTTCSPVSIGTGTVSWEYPLFTYYHDSRTQVIYLASEIGRAGNISALSINVLSVPPQALNNWTIRMKHTTLSGYATANLEATGWTTVYQANEPAGTTGWRSFTFATPFAYNGTDNLMVDFSINNDSYTNYAYCAATNLATYRSVTSYSDSQRGDPLTWSGTSYASRAYNIPNVRLTVCAVSGPPTAPTSLAFTSKTASSIAWQWTRNSNNEDGFRGHDALESVVWTAPAGATTYSETGLTANTQYTRHVHAYNGSGISGPSNTVSTYTLPAAPHATCNHQAGCPALAVNTTCVFTNAVGFAGGGVNHYHYVWDRNPTCTFTGSETTWSSGTLSRVPNLEGSWYLHLLSHNSAHESGGTLDVGPFVVRTNPGAGYAPGDYDEDCHVGTADWDIFTDCAAGPGMPLVPDCDGAQLDGDSDLDQADFAIFQRCWTGDTMLADVSCAD